MPYKPPLPDLHPTIQNVHAVVTTRWKGNAYRPLQITSLESYYLDTSLDNDADAWTIDIGDPEGDYKALLKRDNEVRVQLYGVGHEGLSYMLTGITDDLDYENGTWSLIGRDLSSLAIDSTVLPRRWAKARAWSVVKAQAHEIGFQRTQLSRTGIVKKLQFTDGSESYWDFWYRLYRQEKMWLWTLPNGTLVGGKLNYSADPIYYLGDPMPDDGDYIRSRIIPVETAVLSKTVQGRLYEVVVYGTRGGGNSAKGVGFNVPVHDPTLRHWIKRPRKVMLDTQSRTPNAARRAAWEEIFEGKVGSVEYKLTIPDPGFAIQTNQIARLNLADIDLHGEFFVVGTRIQGGPDGFVQEVRLREKEMALSKRVPSAPKLQTGEPSSKVAGSLGNTLDQFGMPRGWGDYFIKAAKKYHGVMDYSLFLATLIAICHAETNFRNIRQNGGPGVDGLEWYPYHSPDYYKKLPGQLLPNNVFETRSEWERHFANEPGVYGITSSSPWGPPPGQGGVGPMQLTSINLKHAADDLLSPGKRDQYSGGRWHPEHNIMIGARTLATNVQEMHATRDSDMWLAVMAYNMGSAGARAYFNANGTLNQYAQTIKKYVLSDPGYLAQVQAGIQSASSAANDGWTSPATSSNAPPNLPKPAQIHAFFNSFDPIHASNATKRQAIVYAALWGYYQRASMNYLQHRPMVDMAPPPNVPGNLDCSQFATWCYQSAHAPNPNGTGHYDGSGSTYVMKNFGSAISAAQLRLGDLVFYRSPAHVAVYIGNGYVCEMGSDPGPLIQPIRYRTDFDGMRTYF